MKKKSKKDNPPAGGKKVMLSEIQIQQIKKSIGKSIGDLEQVNEILNDSLGIKKSNISQKIKLLKSSFNDESKIIEGIFNGEKMLSKDKKYSVPANYASKSKLVFGDKLKLTITSDGTFIYKQIGPVKRKRLIGILSEKNNKFIVTANGDKFVVLPASVTYFKLKPKDPVTIIVPQNKKSKWATIENVQPNE